jgi:hypothetical protein
MNKAILVVTMWLVSMVMLVPVTARTQGGPFQSILNAIASLQAQIAGIEGPRAFYLTTTEHNGAQALTACAAGFHMASLWEIWDPSNLRYDTTRGFTMADAGSGPPGALGWVRTGRDAGTNFINVQNNCNAYTSSDPSHDGAQVELVSKFDSMSIFTISPWVLGGGGFNCSFALKVWCVED